MEHISLRENYEKISAERRKILSNIENDVQRIARIMSGMSLNFILSLWAAELWKKVRIFSKLLLFHNFHFSPFYSFKFNFLPLTYSISLFVVLNCWWRREQRENLNVLNDHQSLSSFQNFMHLRSLLLLSHSSLLFQLLDISSHHCGISPTPNFLIIQCAHSNDSAIKTPHKFKHPSTPPLTCAR